MPNRLSKEKAQAIAAEYCKNGHKKVLGLLAVGYSESYAKTGEGLKTYENPLVKRAISVLEARTATKAEMTIEKVQKLYERAFRFGKKVNQAGAMVSATTGIARLYGMDKDAGVREQTVIVISPKADKRPIIDAEEA